MPWRFWQSPAPQKLSGQIRKSLVDQFPLDAGMVDNMRVLGKMGRFSGRRVEYIRIFDPARIDASGSGRAVALTYDHLEGNQAHRRSLLFEGHVESDHNMEQVYLKDVRSS